LHWSDVFVRVDTIYCPFNAFGALEESIGLSSGFV